mmetsp:Transcript_25964/g.58633  ORF Transcript_25964/g.58633 Transcript_25964/m.58633 type:complete len:203 (+) Transcript_25964:340-948(+)
MDRLVFQREMSKLRPKARVELVPHPIPATLLVRAVEVETSRRSSGFRSLRVALSDPQQSVLVDRPPYLLPNPLLNLPPHVLLHLVRRGWLPLHIPCIRLTRIVGPSWSGGACVLHLAQSFPLALLHSTALLVLAQATPRRDFAGSLQQRSYYISVPQLHGMCASSYPCQSPLLQCSKRKAAMAAGQIFFAGIGPSNSSLVVR